MKPATPLPWWTESGVLHAKHPDKWTESNHACIHPGRFNNDQDAEYAAHACSAYPFLCDIARAAGDIENDVATLAYPFVALRRALDRYYKFMDNPDGR